MVIEQEQQIRMAVIASSRFGCYVSGKGGICLMRSYGKKAMLAGIFFMALNASVSAASVTVTGQGGSERSALHQAMRQAIEQQVGVLVDKYQ